MKIFLKKTYEKSCLHTIVEDICFVELRETSADPWRWAVLTAFSANAFANAFLFMDFNVVPDVTKVLFGYCDDVDNDCDDKDDDQDNVDVDDDYDHYYCYYYYYYYYYYYHYYYYYY